MFEAAEHARDGDVAYFRALAPAELDSLVIAKDEDGRSLLHTAAAGGHLELLELLAGAGAARVASKADDEVCFFGGGRGLRAMCLHVCLSATHIHQSNILKTTLHFQLNKQTNKQGWTPLHSAASAGHEKAVAALLRLGAAVDAANSGGQTALHYAVRFVDLAPFLLLHLLFH